VDNESAPKGRLTKLSFQLFLWQEEYGAFGVSVSQLDKTIEYLKGQEEHHRRMTFQAEFLALLKKHRVEYDERYLSK
jgi:putative transposase